MPRFLTIALVAFTLLGLLATASEPASAAEKYTRGLRYPSLTPDGASVVFCYRGDIWITTVDGKSPARRLTIHEAQDTLPRVSPDGKTIAFSSMREGSYDIYLMPVEGGEARRLTFHSGLEIVCDWSPDGKHVLFASNRDPSIYRMDLYEVPAAGGATRRITKDGARDGTYSPDGKTVAYARGFNSIYWDDYEGSANYDLYTIARAGGLPQRVSKTGGNERYPMYAADGKSLWFVAEEKKVANVYSKAIGEISKNRTQVTKFTGNDVHRPCLGWDRKTLVYERWGQLYTSDLTEKSPKANLLPLLVKGDRRHSGVSKRTVTTGAQQICVSKDGSMMLFSLHGDIWMTNGTGGTARRLTSGPHIDEWPRISPDGRRIAFQSNRSGNSDIFLMDGRGGGITQLTKNTKGDFFHAWSPDGTKLVFCSDRSGNRDIWTIDVESKELTQLTKDPAGDDDPVFSPDGRSIAFDSAREGNQAIFIMDADGGNVRRITTGTRFLQVPNYSPDGTMLTYEVFNPTNAGSGGIYVIAASGGPSMQISRDGSAAYWSPRGDYIYFSVGAQGREEIYRVQAPQTIENREKVPFMGEIEVDLRKELADLFDEAWVRLGQGFYDPKMHGVDWKKMRAKYRDMAIDAENKDEFQNVVRQMLAELGASHLGINGGIRASNAVRSRPSPTGYLGLELADGAGKNGGRKIESIFPKGPADNAGLRVGDEIIAINGKKVEDRTDIDQLLAGTVGKETRIRFRPITEDGPGAAREEKAKPISVGQLRAMRYGRMVSDNADKVRKATKRKVGYIHLNAMNPQNLMKFQRAVSTWNRRKSIKGMIIDIRENGGGNIHQQLMQILMAKPFAHVKLRGSPVKMTQPSLYWDKPVVVLINERSFSDAEVFPYIFKATGTGKVVGVPTPGGVIGTNDITLSDGTTFRIPRTGYYGLDGTNLEGLGVKPDYVVELTAEDRLEGRDPQLDKAIEVVLEEIKTGRQATPAKPTPSKPTPAQPTPTQPTPQKPGADGASAKASAMNPLADVKNGEWVRFKARLPGGTEDTVIKLRVVDVEDDSVSFERDVEEGPPLPIPLPNEAPRTPLLEGLATMGRIVNQETITADVKGKRAEVAIITLEAFGGLLKMHFSNAVPCMGLLKIEMGKAVVMEAVEWGIDAPAADEPDEKPAEEPAKTPTKTPKRPDTEPAKPSEPTRAPRKAPADAQGPANPLYDAKVGEWVRMRSVVQGEETVATLRVVEVGEETVKLESRVSYGGTEIKGAVLERPRRERMSLGGRGGRSKVEVGKETLEIKGRKLECVTITRTTRRGQVDKRWICADIPVNGLVRHMRGEKLVKELLDWGVGEPPASSSASK